MADTLTLNEGVIISDNTAGTAGGGVYVYTGDTAIINGTLVDGNAAGVDGGGVYVETGASLVSAAAQFTNNAATAGDGGGIYDADTTYTNLTTDAQTIFSGNTASSAFLGTTDVPASISWASLSTGVQPLNNYDINYRQADFEYTKTSSPDPVGPGDQTTVSISITNTGNAPESGPFIFTDALPSGLTYGGSLSPSFALDGSQSEAAPTSTAPVAFTIGDDTTLLNPGSTLTLSFPVTVDADDAAPTLPNLATIQSPSQTGSASNSVNINLRPDFSGSSKTASTALAQPGDQVTYTITASNALTAGATSGPITVSEALPAGMSLAQFSGSSQYEVSAIVDGQQIYPVVVGGTSQNPTFTLNLPMTLPDGSTVSQIGPGQSVQFVFAVAIDASVAVGTSLINTAALQSSDDDLGTSLTADPVAIAGPDISTATKTPSLSIAAPGDMVTYTIAVPNTGALPANALTVSDLLPPGTVLLSSPPPVVLVDGAAAAWSNSGTASNPVFSINGPIASKATITYSVQVPIDAPLGSSLANSATVSAPNAPSQTVAATVPVGDPDFVNVSKIPSSQTASVGDTVTYALQATNNRNVATNPLIIADSLPTGMSLAVGTPTSATLADGTLLSATVDASDAQNPIFTVSPAILPGQTVNLTFVAAIDASASGNLVNSALVQAEPGATPVTVTAPPVSIAPANFGTATKTSTTPIPISPGTTVDYIATLPNTGAGTAVAPIQVADHLPTGMTYVPGSAVATLDGNPISVAAAASGSSLIFTVDQNVPAGSTIVVRYSVATDPAVASGAYVNTITVPGSSQPISGPSIPVGEPALTAASKIVAPASALPGSTVAYTIKVLNSGAVDASPLTIADALPAGLSYHAQSEIAATIDGAPATVSVSVDDQGNPLFTFDGPLPPNAVATLTFNASVNVGTAPGIYTNRASIAGHSGDSGISVQDSGLTVTALATGPAVFAKSSSPAQAPLGSTIAYAFTYENPEAIAGNLTLSDILPSGVTFPVGAEATVTVGGASESIPNTGTATNPIFVITGPFPANTSVDISFDGTTNMSIPIGSTVVNQAVMDDGASHATAKDGGVLMLGPNFSKASKTSSPATVQAGDTVSYTITATNTGSAPAAGFTITDALPPELAINPLSHIAAKINGIPTNDLTVGGTPQVPIFSIKTPIGVNDTVTLTFDGIVAAGTPTGTAIVNTATVRGFPEDAGVQVQDSGVVAVDPPVVPDAPDAFTKTVSPRQIQPGDSVAYTFTYVNHEPLPNGFTLRDPLQPHFFLPDGESATLNGVPIPNTGTSTVPEFIIPGPIPADSSSTITFTVSSDEGLNLGTFQNTGILDNGSIRLSATDEGISVGSALSITKTSQSDAPRPGGSIAYTVTVSNTGTAPTKDLVVTDALPAFALLADPSSATAEINGLPVAVAVSGPQNAPVFTFGQQLNPGESLTLTFSVAISTLAAAGSLLQNTALAQDSHFGSIVSATDGGIILQFPELSKGTLTKTADVDSVYPGGSIAYTLTYTNVDPIPTHLAIQDALPNFVSLGPNQVATVYINGIAYKVENMGSSTNPSFILPVPLAANSTVSLSFIATVAKNALPGTQLVNTATATDGHSSLKAQSGAVLVSCPSSLEACYDTCVKIQAKGCLPIKPKNIVGSQISAPRCLCDCCKEGLSCLKKPLLLQAGAYTIKFRIIFPRKIHEPCAKIGACLNKKILNTSVASTPLTVCGKTLLEHTFTVTATEEMNTFNLINLGNAQVFCSIDVCIVKS